MQSETKIFVTNIYRRRGCEGGALFVKQNKRGPESEWNLQSKLASGPIAVVNWPSLPLKIVSLAISSRNFFWNACHGRSALYTAVSVAMAFIDLATTSLGQ